MFGYLRLFSIVSFIAILLIAGLVGAYFRSLASEDLRVMAERGNQAITSGYAQSVWNQYRYPVLARAGVSGLDQARQVNPEFTTRTDEFVRDTEIGRFNIYNGAGKALYSSGGELTVDAVINQDIANLRSGDQGVFSQIIHEQPSLRTGVTDNESVLVRTLVHMIEPGVGEVFIETFADISPEWKKIILMQWVTSGIIIAIFVILMWILILSSIKAEEIIARQHESNVELEAAAAVAKAESQQKSLFLANISHELRTPLNAIIGFSEIIQQEVGGQSASEQFVNYVDDIHSAGVHLLSLINDILDFSKAEAGKLELEISEVNASKMVQNCLRLVLPRAEAAGVELVDAMPKETLVLTTDNKKLKQILLNLLSNAVKFTQAGGQVRVTGWRDLANDMVMFEVKDSGIGIAPKDISRAMQPFGQVDNTLSRKYEGTGLGLPLTKKFIELMGGRMDITSQQNVGTTIIFSLPVHFAPTGDVPVKRVA